MSRLEHIAGLDDRAAINKTLHQVFENVEPKAATLPNGEAVARFLTHLNVSFSQMYGGLSALSRRQLNAAMPVARRRAIPRTLLDQRDQRDFGAISTSPDFGCFQQVVKDEIYLNDEQDQTSISLARHFARGKAEVYRGRTQQSEVYDFASEDRSIVTMEVLRNDTQYQYTYAPHAGVLHYPRNPDLDEGAKIGSADHIFGTFHAMAAILVDRELQIGVE